MMTSAMDSVPIIFANGSAFSNLGGTALCFLLAGRSVEEGLEQLLGKGGIQTSWASTSSFPPTSFSSFQFDSFGLGWMILNGSPLSLLTWIGLSLWGPAGLGWSLWIPGLSLKTQGHTFHIPYCRTDVPPYYT